MFPVPDIAEIIQSGAGNPWLYLPAALLLGALHALEPGHSKSMMAAFIIAVRGTVWQATVLGLCAAIGHTAVIWALVALGLWLGDQLILDKAEPWLMLATGMLIVLIAVRIFYLTAPPRRPPTHGHDHGDHTRHHHDHDVSEDRHAAEHAADLERRLAGRPVTTFDIAWFGFTAGLLPCPAAFAVLLICLQLKEVTLGVAMVAAFSMGLAVTLVAIGVAAAWSVQTASRRWSGFDRLAARLPLVSAGIVLVVGLVVTWQGLSGIASA